MFIPKTLLITLTIFFTTHTVYAAVWYDTLPESGEFAPRPSPIDGVRPNYEGNINFQTEHPLEFMDSAQQTDDSSAHTGSEALPVSAEAPSKAPTPVWVWVAGVLLVCGAVAAAWYYFFFNKRGAS